jgi:16S rRNA processing protein RimM
MKPLQIRLLKRNYRNRCKVIRIYDPMAYIKHILLGKITKVHGHDGAVTIRLERDFSDRIPVMESVFIETDGRPVPFFIDYSEQPALSTLRIKFEDYSSVEKVKEFVGCKLFMTEAAVNVKLLSNPLDLINYKVFSDENASIGIITEIIENPGQLLLNIQSSSGKYFLLPLHDDLITDIDSDNKIIRMMIPDGIMDIN